MVRNQELFLKKLKEKKKIIENVCTVVLDCTVQIMHLHWAEAMQIPTWPLVDLGVQG